MVIQSHQSHTISATIELSKLGSRIVEDDRQISARVLLEQSLEHKDGASRFVSLLFLSQLCADSAQKIRQMRFLANVCSQSRYCGLREDAQSLSDRQDCLLLEQLAG